MQRPLVFYKLPELEFLKQNIYLVQVVEELYLNYKKPPQKSEKLPII